MAVEPRDDDDGRAVEGARPVELLDGRVARIGLRYDERELDHEDPEPLDERNELDRKPRASTSAGAHSSSGASIRIDSTFTNSIFTDDGSAARVRRRIAVGQARAERVTDITYLMAATRR